MVLMLGSSAVFVVVTIVVTLHTLVTLTFSMLGNGLKVLRSRRFYPAYSTVHVEYAVHNFVFPSPSTGFNFINKSYRALVYCSFTDVLSRA